MQRVIVSVVSALLLANLSSSVFAQPTVRDEPWRGLSLGPPTLSVTGRGETTARPDRAVVSLGATAQAEQADAAQREVNQIVQRALESIKALGVPDERITTVGLSLHPVYSQRPPRPLEEPADPRIIGYRASNIIRVQLDDLSRLGPVIDAAVAAGANQLQGVSFELRNDLEARQDALRLAVREARAKAEAIADAMGVRLGEAREIIEGDVHLVRPMADARMAFAGAEAATPVQPGEVSVHATVTLRYRIIQDARRPDRPDRPDRLDPPADAPDFRHPNEGRIIRRPQQR